MSASGRQRLCHRAVHDLYLQYGNISLSDGVIEFAKTHEEIKGAFTFQKDADQIYPGWKEKLGYTGESSVQAASFDCGRPKWM